VLLSQILNPDGTTGVIARDGPEAAYVRNVTGSHALACDAVASLRSVSQVVTAHGLAQAVDLPGLAASGRVLRPITPPTPLHFHCLGTIPAGGVDALARLAAVHVVGHEGLAVRIGWTLAMPPHDDPTASLQVSFGPEILLGDLPEDLRGTLRIRRRGELVFETVFRSDIGNALPEIEEPPAPPSTTGQTCRMGEVHLYLFPVLTLGPLATVQPAQGDMIEIEASAFGLPLCTAFAVTPPPERAVVLP